MCSNCGTALEIFEDGKSIGKGYSPFTAEKYHIHTESSVPTANDKDKSRPVKKKRHINQE